MKKITFPIGRMVTGDLYKMSPRLDNLGKPKMGRDGLPEMECKFGFAILKGTERHWSQTSWGAEVLEVGRAAYPAEHASPSFAWKITDGDSTVPNKKGRAPSTNENYRGHWVIWFGQGWLPPLFNAEGTAELTAPGAIVPGYFIRVLADVKSNAPSASPGVYLNPAAVALIGEGDRITATVDTSSFGSSPMGTPPPGMRPLTPVTSVFDSPDVRYGTPGFTGGAAFQDVPEQRVAAPAPPAPPNPAFLNVPPLPQVPARVMLPPAGGATYEQMISAGWTDELMIQHGMMRA